MSLLVVWNRHLRLSPHCLFLCSQNLSLFDVWMLCSDVAGTTHNSSNLIKQTPKSKCHEIYDKPYFRQINSHLLLLERIYDLVEYLDYSKQIRPLNKHFFSLRTSKRVVPQAMQNFLIASPNM